MGGGYCRLQMPLRLALGVRGTVAGHRLGALEGGGGGQLFFLLSCIYSAFAIAGMTAFMGRFAYCNWAGAAGQVRGVGQGCVRKAVRRGRRRGNAARSY